MATHTGSEGTIKIGTDTLGELRSYTLETTGATIESSNMGTTARTYKAGLKAWSGSASLFFDETDAGQLLLVLGTERPEWAFSLVETFTAETWEEAFKHYRDFMEWQNCFDITL